MGDTVSAHKASRRHRSAPGTGWSMPPACVLEGRGAAALLCGMYRLPDKTGVPKGASLWHTALLAKCSVLYLLSRLAGKMRVSPDGNTPFARQENGQVFVNRNEQKSGWFRKWQQVYVILTE